MRNKKLYLFLVTFKTSKFAYYVWATNIPDAIREVIKERPEFAPADVETAVEILPKRGLLIASLKENAT